MNLLGLDTSSSACSVALLVQGKMSERHVALENRHSEYILRFINELITEAGVTVRDLDALAVGNGPGSFTGLRLGIGVAQGLAFGASKPVLSVSSMKAIAAASSASNILVAVDARMGEVYWQCFYHRGGQRLTPLDSVRLNRPGDIVLAQPEQNWQGVGSGFDQYSQILSGLLSDHDNWIKAVTPRASSVINLALAEIETAGMPVDYSALPVYVRNKVTQ